MLMRRVPPRAIIALGIVLSAAGFLLLMQLAPTTAYVPLILLAEVVVGVGSGLIAPPALNTALTGIADADVGAAAAMSSTSNQIGGSIGAALLNTLAVSATAAYVAAHPVSAGTASATIHGFTGALAWGGGIELAGALLVFALITRGSSARTTHQA
jgi:hypothetical protein